MCAEIWPLSGALAALAYLVLHRLHVLHRGSVGLPLCRAHRCNLRQVKIYNLKSGYAQVYITFYLLKKKKGVVTSGGRV